MTSLKRLFLVSSAVLAAFATAGTAGSCAEGDSSEHEEPATAISFGSVMDRVLATEGPDAQCFLDLDTGKLHTAPKEIAGDKDATDAWCLKNGIDIRRGKPVEGAGSSEMLDIKAVQMKAEAWKESPQVVAGQIGRARRHRRIVLSHDPVRDAVHYVLGTGNHGAVISSVSNRHDSFISKALISALNLQEPELLTPLLQTEEMRQ